MPKLYRSSAATGRKPTPYPPSAGVAVAVPFTFTVTSALAAGDIIEIGTLPASATLADATLVTDDLDTNATPTVVLDVGLMSGEAGVADASRTCGNELFAASNIGQTGGVVRMSKPEGFRLVPDAQKHRGIGVKVVTPPATPALNATISLIAWIVM